MRRDRALISTKIGLPLSDDTGAGTSRSRLLQGTEDALRRLGTDHIDLLQLHAYDAHTPMEEVLATLDVLVRSGKVRYVGASNFAGWQLMRSLAVADRYGYPRHVAHQVYYSLVGRDYEWELLPLAAAEGVGAIVWSPLGWGRLTGRIRRDRPVPQGSRLHATAQYGPRVDDERLYDVVDALAAVAGDTGRSIPQVAINWLLRRPTVASVIVGARTEEQLHDNLGAVGWELTDEHVRLLDAASHTPAPYPYAPYEYSEAFAGSTRRWSRRRPEPGQGGEAAAGPGGAVAEERGAGAGADAC